VAVEFAIVSVLLMVLLFGLISFGLAYSKLNVYVGAAREGARYAAVRCNPDPPCTNAKIAARVSNAAVGYPIGPGSPTASRVCDDAALGQTVNVSWTQNIDLDVPFVPGLDPFTISRTIQGVFRCE
jgi:Flp pilus assembly protein TadG